jgi:hypothetical protein
MVIDLVNRLTMLVAVRRFPSLGVADSHSLRYESYTRKEYVRRSTSAPFSRFLGDVRHEFMHGNYMRRHGSTLGSYLCDALHEGGAIVVALLPASLLRGLRFLGSFFIILWCLCLVDTTAFFDMNYSSRI